MFLVHVNVCDFADTMLIVVQINLIWFELFDLKLIYKLKSTQQSEALVHWLKLLAWKVGDRGSVARSGIQVS